MTGAIILDGHSRAATEATQALGRAGISVCVCAADPRALAFHSRYARLRLHQQASVPHEAFLRWLREVDAQHDFQLIIPSTENSLLAFVDLPKDDPLRARAILPSAEALRSALKKDQTLALASRLGIPVPSTRLIQDAAEIGEARSFPVVLKPVSSKVAEAGKMSAFEPAIVRDAATRKTLLNEWLARVAVLEQEYVPGWGLGIEMLYVNGTLAWSLAHERLHEWPLTGGASTYRRAIEPPTEMLAAAKRLLDELKWHGVAMVEFKRRDDGSFALMEINPRFWGSLALSIDAGVNFPLGLWKIATGRQVGGQPDYRRGLRTRDLAKDLRWLFANAAADRANPLLLLRPRPKSFLELGLIFVNRERWDHFEWTDPGPILQTIKKMIYDLLSGLRQRWRGRQIVRQRDKVIQKAVARIAEVQLSREPRLLFVCQGNICRSPFAEMAARDRMPGFQIESAGFDGRVGRTTPQVLAEQAAILGVQMSRCQSTPLAQEHIDNADLILIMDLTHYDQLAVAFPGCLDRVVFLGLFADKPAAVIEDPMNRDVVTTARVLKQILASVDGLTERLPQLVGTTTGAGEVGVPAGR